MSEEVRGETHYEEMERRAGRVSPEEAHEIASRFNASHWKNSRPLPDKEVARYSIPADPTRDDDLRLGVFIRAAARNEKSLAAMKAYMEWLLDPKFIIRWNVSAGMTFFVFQNLEAFANAYEKLKDVPRAAEAARQQLETEALLRRDNERVPT